jgi:hypothetical protein
MSGTLRPSTLVLDIARHFLTLPKTATFVIHLTNDDLVRSLYTYRDA